MTTTNVSTAPAGAEARPPEMEPLRTALREGPRAGAIQAAGFREALEFLTPRAEEMAWASIPWQTDLMRARQLAAEAGRPIFMWAMNGNPLGCV